MIDLSHHNMEETICLGRNFGRASIVYIETICIDRVTFMTGHRSDPNVASCQDTAPANLSQTYKKSFIYGTQTSSDAIPEDFNSKELLFLFTVVGI